MEKHKIVIDSEEFFYKLYYKNIKSIYIKIENNELIVSAPKYTSIIQIEDLLREYKDKYIQRLKEYEPFIEYKDKGKVILFNQEYQIKLYDIKERKCMIHQHYLYVYHHDIMRTVDSYLKELLYDYIQERIIYYLSYHFDLNMPSIVIKSYKRRWGSCYYKENKVTFNIALVHLDKELIDYVIVHELCHFLQPNHSQQFYHEIEKRIPDYQIKIKRLKEIHI